MNIGYKKLQNGLIAELEILGENNEKRKNVVVKEMAKYRCSEVKVLSITDIDGILYDIGFSMYKWSFSYEVGKIIKTNYDTNIENVCSEGIHYFKNKERALRYYETVMSDNFTGKYEKFYDNGVLEFEKNYKNGLLDGCYTRRHENGVVSVRKHYINGLLDGIYESWYDNSKIHFKEHYINDKRDGESLGWYNNGQLSWQKHYKNGRLDGECKRWNLDGTLEYIKNYKDGEFIVES